MQKIEYDDFTLEISITNKQTAKALDMIEFKLYMKEQFLDSIALITPIKSVEELQDDFDYVMTKLGEEFCRVDELHKYYHLFAPHIKELLSNYCIRENNDEDIKDVNLLYIRSKFVENS